MDDEAEDEDVPAVDVDCKLAESPPVPAVRGSTSALDEDEEEEEEL